MIFIDSTVTRVFPNLFERGESLTSETTYTLKLVSDEITSTIQADKQAKTRTERYFEFDLPDLTNAKDGYYEFQVLDGETLLYSEVAFISKSSAVTYYQNEITNTYFSNAG